MYKSCARFFWATLCRDFVSAYIMLPISFEYLTRIKSAVVSCVAIGSVLMRRRFLCTRVSRYTIILWIRMDWQHEYNLNLVDWVQYTALIIIIKNLK